ncbi:MAG: TlpA disulfide reductase family protein [Planctomycetota bacterium]
MSKVGDLAELHKKYFDVGFRVVAISSEAPDLVKRKMIEGAGATYWIGSDPDGATHTRYSDGGSTAIPRFYLVGADGKVISSKPPSEAELRQLLEKPLLLERETHAKLARSRTAYDAGVFGAAHKVAKALLKDKDAAVAADAALVCSKIEGRAEFLQKLMALESERDPNERYGDLLRFAFEYDGLAPARWARTQLADLKKVDRVKGFLPEWSKYENALRSEMLAEGNPDKLRLVQKLYDEVARKFDRSLVGELATAASKRLEGGH